MRPQFSKLQTVVLAVLLCVSLGPRLRADVTGQILGTALDTSGAAVPGVKVVATNLDTNLSQQAVTNLRRLVRQRARWFQGHLQCFKLIPQVLRSSLKREQVNDLVYHLASPSLVLLMSPGVVAYCAAFATLMVSAPRDTIHTLINYHGLPLLIAYVLTFGMAPFYGFAYWLRERSTPLWKALLYSHVFSLYGYLWFPAGWLAAWRVVRRKNGWTKTARTAEPAVAG